MNSSRTALVSSGYRLIVSMKLLHLKHASSATGAVTPDTKQGEYAYWGRLKDGSM